MLLSFQVFFNIIVTVSTVKPEGDYIPLTRLVADEGYTLTDGLATTSCTDTANPEGWEEVEEHQTPEEQIESLDRAYTQGVNSL